MINIVYAINMVYIVYIIVAIYNFLMISFCYYNSCHYPT